jgi:hypothetical protein
VQRPLTSGTRGWLTSQTSWPADPTLQPLAGEALSGVGSRESSRAFARAPEVVLEIGELLYLHLSL